MVKKKTKAKVLKPPAVMKKIGVKLTWESDVLSVLQHRVG